MSFQAASSCIWTAHELPPCSSLAAKAMMRQASLFTASSRARVARRRPKRFSSTGTSSRSLNSSSFCRSRPRHDLGRFSAALGTDELLKKGATVTILTRDDTKAELQPLAKVDYDDEQSLEAALAGSEVAVCAIHSYHIASQLPVARAAKAAGVQLFVPTEYGIPVVDGPNVMKQKVRDQLKELDLPYTLFHTGLWAEFLSLYVSDWNPTPYEAFIM